MFEIGGEYKIAMTDPTEPDSVTYIYGKVIAYEYPLLKIKEDDGAEKIINVSSPLFIEASRRH